MLYPEYKTYSENPTFDMTPEQLEERYHGLLRTAPEITASLDTFLGCEQSVNRYRHMMQTNSTNIDNLLSCSGPVMTKYLDYLIRAGRATKTGSTWPRDLYWKAESFGEIMIRCHTAINFLD